MVLITAIQAACFTLIKTGLDSASPLLFGGLRASIGGSALLAFSLINGGGVLPPTQAWAGTLFLAVVATTVTFAAMFLSPGRTEAGVASAVGNLQPFVTLVLAAIFLNEALTQRKIAAVVLGFAGVILISYPALADEGALGISGVILAASVSLGSSVGNVVIKKMQLGGALLTVTAWQLVLGGVLLIFISRITHDSSLDANLKFFSVLLFLALIGTGFTTALWYSFVQEGEVGQLATFFFLVPVFGLGLAVIAFGEPVTVAIIGGATLILVAVVVVSSQIAEARS